MNERWSRAVAPEQIYVKLGELVFVNWTGGFDCFLKVLEDVAASIVGYFLVEQTVDNHRNMPTDRKIGIVSEERHRECPQALKQVTDVISHLSSVLRGPYRVGRSDKTATARQRNKKEDFLARFYSKLHSIPSSRESQNIAYATM